MTDFIPAKYRRLIYPVVALICALCVAGGIATEGETEHILYMVASILGTSTTGLATAYRPSADSITQ